LIALAQSRLHRTGTLDRDAREWLNEAHAVCRAQGLCSWAQHIEALHG
jgi:hypothetical protein